MPVSRTLRICAAITVFGATVGLLGFLVSLFHPIYSNSPLTNFRLQFLNDLLPLSQYITAVNALAGLQSALTTAAAIGLYLLVVRMKTGGGRLLPLAGLILVLVSLLLIVAQAFYSLGRGDSLSPIPQAVLMVFNAAEVVRLAGLLVLGAAVVTVRTLPLWLGALLFAVVLLESNALALLLLLQPVTEESAGYSAITSITIELVPVMISFSWLAVCYPLLSYADRLDQPTATDKEEATGKAPPKTPSDPHVKDHESEDFETSTGADPSTTEAPESGDPPRKD